MIPKIHQILGGIQIWTFLAISRHVLGATTYVVGIFYAYLDMFQTYSRPIETYYTHKQGGLIWIKKHSDMLHICSRHKNTCSKYDLDMFRYIIDTSRHFPDMLWTYQELFKNTSRLLSITSGHVSNTSRHVLDTCKPIQDHMFWIL